MSCRSSQNDNHNIKNQLDFIQSLSQCFFLELIMEKKQFLSLIEDDKLNSFLFR